MRFIFIKLSKTCGLSLKKGKKKIGIYIKKHTHAQTKLRGYCNYQKCENDYKNKQNVALSL